MSECFFHRKADSQDVNINQHASLQVFLNSIFLCVIKEELKHNAKPPHPQCKKKQKQDK